MEKNVVQMLPLAVELLRCATIHLGILRSLSE